MASIAVSDGVVLYAADVRSGGLQQRIACRLEHGDPQQALWWLSVHGIYRQPPQLDGQLPERQAESRADARGQQQATGEVPLHGKYKLPASCFAYVGDPSDPRSWHLPYLNADGSVDGKRLPGAIRAILSNYRGANVSAIPESAVPDVLVRLGCAAGAIGKLDPACAAPETYTQLLAALDQLGRMGEIAQ